ncbi:MAG: zf-HC2 domain-containing protein [Candidatus Caldatribacterium sp.]|nr:zf-HC2 domain-containing protein [Candidatus Caldatribacterium sp.]
MSSFSFGDEAMRCRDVSRRLSAFLDRELPAWEYREVARHLGVCLRCRREYEKLSAVKTMVQRVGQMVPSAVPGVAFPFGSTVRTFRLRKALLALVFLFGLFVAILLVLGWQRSSLDEEILSPDQLTAFSRDVLTQTKVRVETIELVTGDYR